MTRIWEKKEKMTVKWKIKDEMFRFGSGNEFKLYFNVVKVQE